MIIILLLLYLASIVGTLHAVQDVTNNPRVPIEIREAIVEVRKGITYSPSTFVLAAVLILLSAPLISILFLLSKITQ